MELFTVTNGNYFFEDIVVAMVIILQNLSETLSNTRKNINITKYLLLFFKYTQN